MRYIVLIFSFLISIPSWSCDICGCGVGNIYTGIMPQFQQNFAGIRYRNIAFRSHLKSSKIFQTDEYFHTTEIWARYYPIPKLQLLTFLPYQYNMQIEKGKDKRNTLQGFGDMSILASYNLINTSDGMQRAKQNWWVGLGIKLPTGKYTYSPNSNIEVANANFQLGSGSTDFLANTLYTLRFNKWGMTTDMSYKINTANSNQYQFGNRFSNNVALFYIAKYKGIGFMPYLGNYYEYSASDSKNDEIVKVTGGFLSAVSVGCEFYYKKLIVGGNLQTPYQQYLAEENIKAENRYTAHISFLF